MKKVLFILLILLIPIKVYAKNVLDNYLIEVTIEYPKVHIVEKFDVLKTDEDSIFEKELYGDETLIDSFESNINEYKQYKVGKYTYLQGEITPNNSYFIDYYITDYRKRGGNNAYRFEAPIRSNIYNLSLTINHDKNDLNVEVYGYNREIFTMSKTEKTITGKLANREIKNPTDLIFMANSSIMKNQTIIIKQNLIQKRLQY